MQAIRSGRAVLHVSDQGPPDAPGVVFVNSLGTDLRIWDAVVARLPGLRILRYDLRGHGLSDAPEAAFAIDDHAADLEAVLAARAVRPIMAVGLSVGGQIALHWAAERPQGLRALVLCDTAPRIGTAQAWNARIAAVENGGMAAIAEGVLARWFPPAFGAAEPERLALMRTMLLRCDPAGYAAACAAIRDANLTGFLAGITVPTLCLVGSEDMATAPETVAAMAQGIAGARCAVIEGAGHLPCVDAPDAVAGHIAALIEEVHRG